MSIADDPQCAGFVLTIPVSVWSSWKKHLGNPTLHSVPFSPKDKVLLAEDEVLSERIVADKSWIFVFDIDSTSTHRPRPLIVTDRIAISTAALLEHAFTRAVKNIAAGNVLKKYRDVLTKRIRTPWHGKRSDEEN